MIFCLVFVWNSGSHTLSTQMKLNFRFFLGNISSIPIYLDDKECDLSKVLLLIYPNLKIHKSPLKIILVPHRFCGDLKTLI